MKIPFELEMIATKAQMEMTILFMKQVNGVFELIEELPERFLTKQILELQKKYAEDLLSVPCAIVTAGRTIMFYQHQQVAEDYKQEKETLCDLSNYKIMADEEDYSVFSTIPFVMN